MNVDDELAKFDRYKDVYLSVQEATVSLLTRLLRAGGITPHSIVARTKSRESLRKKLARIDKEYVSLHDVKDLVGCRIITYFEDELEIVDKIIKSEFEISQKDSYDRKSRMATDQFGYRSIHYVCSYSEERLRLSEYSHLRSQFIEIQSRSILQHAWAEIEHEYYKAAAPKPESIQRRNSRLAGLLELVDAEFIAIRKEMEIYERNVSLRIDAEDNLDQVDIDSISLASFISQDQEILRVEGRLRTITDVTWERELTEKTLLVLLRSCEEMKVTTLGQLSRSLKADGDKLLPFLIAWRKWAKEIGRPSSPVYHNGISIYHLAIFLSARKGRDALAKAFLSIAGRGSDGDFAQKLMTELPKIAGRLGV